ncbi:MAG: hypothetical protein VB674_00455, partial [Vicinamibacterales bacterium]
APFLQIDRDDCPSHPLLRLRRDCRLYLLAIGAQPRGRFNLITAGRTVFHEIQTLWNNGLSATTKPPGKI